MNTDMNNSDRFMTNHRPTVFVLWIALLMMLPTIVKAGEHPRLYFLKSDIPTLIAKSKDTRVNDFGFSTATWWNSIVSHANDFSTIQAYVSLPLGSTVQNGSKLIHADEENSQRIEISVGDTVRIPSGGGPLIRLPIGSSRILSLEVLSNVKCMILPNNRRLIFVKGKDIETIGSSNRVGWNADPFEGNESSDQIPIADGDTISIGFGSGLSEDNLNRPNYSGEIIKFSGSTELVVCLPLFHFEEDVPNVKATAENQFPQSKTFQYVLSPKQPAQHFASNFFAPWTRLTDYLWIETQYLAVAYAVSHDKRYSNVLKQILFSVCNWQRWTDKDYNPKWDSDLDTANLLKIVSMCYDVLYDGLSAADLEFVRTSMIDKGILPIERTMNFDKASSNPGLVGSVVGSYVNSVAVQLSAFGTASAVLMGEDNRANAWVSEAKVALEVVMKKIAAPDGGFYEGFGYGGVTTDELSEMVDVMIRSGLLPSDFFTKSWFYSNLPLFIYNTTSPVDTNQVTFGDASLGRYFSITMNVLAAHGVSAALWYLKSWYPTLLKTWGNEIMPFLLFDKQSFVLTGNNKPNPVSSVYPTIGYAILRDGSSTTSPFLAFRCGPKDLVFGHNHYDQNTFAMDFNGQWLVTAPGYENFSNPFARKYTLGTFGQNTMVMDIDPSYLSNSTVALAGHDQMKQDGGSITDFWTSKIFDSVTGEGADAYNLDQGGHTRNWLNSFRRTIVYVKPDYFLIHDIISSPDRHSFSMLFHYDTIAQCVSEGNGFIIRRHESRLLIDGEFSNGISSQGDYTYKGAESYGKYIEMKSNPARVVRFTTLLLPEQSLGSLPNVPAKIQILLDSDSLQVVNVVFPDYSDVVFFNSKIGRKFTAAVNGSRYSSDGEICLVRHKANGAILRVVLQGGTYFSVNSVDVVSLSAPVGAFIQYPENGDLGEVNGTVSGPLFDQNDKSDRQRTSVSVKIKNFQNPSKGAFGQNARLKLEDGYWVGTMSILR